MKPSFRIIDQLYNMGETIDANEDKDSLGMNFKWLFKGFSYLFTVIYQLKCHIGDIHTPTESHICSLCASGYERRRELYNVVI